MSDTLALGECFPFATKLAAEMIGDDVIPESQIRVVHGIVSPTWHHRPYVHAWVEANGRVFDWQMRQGGAGSLPQADFEAMYRPQRVVKYKAAEAVGLAIRHKHAGPWDDGLNTVTTNQGDVQ